LIAVKDWAKPPSDHVDPYHLGIRLLGCSRQEFSVDLRIIRFHHSFQIGERWWFPFWFFLLSLAVASRDWDLSFQSLQAARQIDFEKSSLSTLLHPIGVFQGSLVLLLLSDQIVLVPRQI
jgi:hypothetical protein